MSNRYIADYRIGMSLKPVLPLSLAVAAFASDSEKLPLRFVAGADAMAAVEANLQTIKSRSTTRASFPDRCRTTTNYRG
jgi:hypothetical protein